METIKINSGVVRLQIDCDGVKDIISFNPNDVHFVEAFYSLYDEFTLEEKRFQEKMKALEADDSLDDLGLPRNVGERIAVVVAYGNLINQKIDTVFGAGTCEKAFRGAMVPEMYEQFFNGVTPYITKDREEKVSKYMERNAAGNLVNVMR